MLKFVHACIRFSNAEGLTTCLDCMPGSAMNGTGATACDSCLPGSFSDQRVSSEDPELVVDLKRICAQGAFVCTICPLGTFSDNPGQSAAKMCSPVRCAVPMTLC